MYIDKTASVKRLQQLQSDSNKEEFSVVSGLEAVPLNIQPANNETTVLIDGQFGKTYRAYTTHSGIKDGDRLTISGVFIDGISVNKELGVSNVENWSFGPLPHFEIVCVEFE